MAIPEGYVALDFVGFTDRGAYNSSATYMINDLVHDTYNSIWRCQQDNTSNVAPAAGAYWTLFMGTSESLTGMMATDTSGVLGSAGQIVVAQSLVDAIADKVMNGLVNKNQIINNLLATVAGNVLDAMQGKLLQDQVTALNGKLLLVEKMTPPTLGTGFTGTVDLVHVVGCPRIIVVNINAIKGSAIVSGDTVAQLPFGCFTEFFGGGVTLLNADGTQNTAYVAAGTDGTIKVTTSAAAARWVRGQIVVCMGN